MAGRVEGGPLGIVTPHLPEMKQTDMGGCRPTTTELGLIGCIVLQGVGGVYAVSLKKYLVRVKYILPGGTGILNQVLLLLFNCLSGTSVFRRIIPDSCFLAGVSLRHFLQLGLLIFTSNNIGLSGEMCS